MKKIFVLALLLALWPCGQSRSQSLPTPNGVPYIRLDKTRFALGEDVFFWVGVRQTSARSPITTALVPTATPGLTPPDPIPQVYWNTCRLTITRPDGTQKILPNSWPLDGPSGSGWLGGSGLGEKASTGKYTLIFEFAGQKSSPAYLDVVDLPILKALKAAFVFGTKPGAPASVTTPVIFTVQNNSDRTIRFPHRDGVSGFVSVRINKPDKSYGNWFFYPANKLLDKDEPQVPNFSFDLYTWAVAQKVPSITLKPGEIYRQTLSVQAALAEASKGLPVSPGRYTMTFSTSLQVLIGEPGGEWAAFSAVRLPIVSTATLHVAP